MKMNTLGLFAAFWAMQVAASLLFKHGSGSPGRWLPCFVLANIVGITSTWFLMVLYRQMPVNMAMGLAVGIAFLLSQMTVAIAFQTNLSLIQYGGILGITAGMLMLCLGGCG